MKRSIWTSKGSTKVSHLVRRHKLQEAEAKAFRPTRRNFTPLRIRAMYVGLAAGRVLVCQAL